MTVSSPAAQATSAARAPVVEAVVFPDVEGAVRTWLRAQPSINSRVGSQVFFGIPTKGATYPLLTIALVGGDVHQYAPLDSPLIQIVAWGPDGSPTVSGKVVAEHLIRAVQTACWSLGSGTELDDGVVSLGAVLVGRPIWSPDPESGRARYVLTVRFTVRIG